MASTTAEAEALARRCEAAGFVVERTTNGYRVLGDNGATVGWHFTPSDHRAQRNRMRDLEKLGLFEREAALAAKAKEERKVVLAADRAKAAKKATTARVSDDAPFAVPGARTTARPTTKAGREADALRRAQGEYAMADDEDWIFRKHPAEAARKFIVTPDLAQRMLDCAEGNRRKRIRHVDEIAAAMSENRFIFTHQGVAFDTSGKFFDGQHRCQAIVDSGKAQPLWVFVGVDPRAVHFVDQHARRSGTDALTMGRGTPPPNIAAVSAVVRFVWIRDHAEPGQWKSTYMDNELLAKEYDADPSGYIYAVRTAGAARQLHKGYTNTPVAALLYIAIRQGAKVHDIEQFIHHYKTGEDLGSGHPVLALRRRADLYSDRSGHVINRKIQFGEWVMAWNAYVEGRKLTTFNHKLDDPIPPIAVRK